MIVSLLGYWCIFGVQSGQGLMQDNYLFADAQEDDFPAEPSVAPTESWKVLIVDDEPEVHTLTKLNLHSIDFRGARIDFLSAYSAGQAEKTLLEDPEIAVVLLDVVMESDNSGLKLVEKIRNEMGNNKVRIILRTGQPGQAPEAEVVLKYDINDYRSKTDLTQERMITTVIGALRNYADMQDLEHSERHRRYIAAKSAARSLFLASVSHEIRTPMHGILGTLELLSNTKPDDDQHSLIKICQDSAGYLLEIIDDILDFSKIDAGKLQIAEKSVSPTEMVHSAVDQLASRAWLKDVELMVYVMPDTPASIECDPKRVSQVLINLVGNAIKFTNHGHIIVRVGSQKLGDDAHELFIEVEDTGIGMTAEQQSRLFTPFEQASVDTGRKYGGTGLGLAISRRLVKLMDGTIELESKPNIGSTFRFSLPVRATDTAPTTTGRLEGRKIMLIGDATDSMQTVVSILNDEQADFLHVSDASQAADKLLTGLAKRQPVEAILIDETVDHHHCIHWLRQIRERERLADIPVGVMIRRSSRSLISRLRGYKVNHIVMKVIRAEALVSGISNLVNSESAGAANEASLPNANKTDPLDVSLSRIRFPGTKILVADDSRTNQFVLRKMLEHLSVSVRIVENGKDAIKALTEDVGTFHLAFIDCFMPDIEGFEVARRLRQKENENGDRLPVIALSASFLPEDIQMSKEVGMDHYVSKPVDIATLANVLDKWLPRDCQRVETSYDEALVLEQYPLLKSKTGKVSIVEEAEKAGIDLTKLLEVYGDLNARSRVLVDMFMRDIPLFIRELETSVARKDPERVRYSAHSIAGSSGVVGAFRLAETAHAIEYNVQGNNWDIIGKLTPQLMGQCEAACRFFEAVDWNE